MSIGTRQVTISRKTDVCPDRPDSLTLCGGVGRHRGAQAANPPGTAGEGLP